MKTIDRKVQEGVEAFEEKTRSKIKLINLAIDDIREQIKTLKEQYHDVVIDIHSIVERLDTLDEGLALINSK